MMLYAREMRSTNSPVVSPHQTSVGSDGGASLLSQVLSQEKPPSPRLPSLYASTPNAVRWSLSLGRLIAPSRLLPSTGSPFLKSMIVGKP